MASALISVSSDQFLPGYLYITCVSVILNLHMHELYKSNDISCKTPLV